jgi:peptidoglycan L-alanyl-D-glutamate endopeptidase CwlK
MSWTLGKNSLERYNTLHPDLQTIIDWGMKYCRIDISITEGHRSIQKQSEYYKRGRQYIGDEWIVFNEKQIITNCDGIRVKSNHNYNPSMAFDYCAYVKDKPKLRYDIAHITYISGSFVTISEILYDQGLIEHKLRWGGNWEKDGDLSNSKWYDRPHLELYKP